MTNQKEPLTSEQYTDEEITIAKMTRDIAIGEGTQTIKAIYMAGEIVMWDQVQTVLSEKDREIAELKQIRADQLEVIKSQRIEIEKWQQDYSDLQTRNISLIEENKRLRDTGENLKTTLEIYENLFGESGNSNKAIEQWKELTK